MSNGPLLLRENRYHQIKAILARLRLDSSARIVVLVDKDGQQIAVHGELGDLDTTSLASLVAGNVAADLQPDLQPLPGRRNAARSSKAETS